MSENRANELLRHCEWADAELWKAVLSAEPDERIGAWMHHVHLVQDAFATVWSDRALDLENLPKAEDHPDARSIAAWGKGRHLEMQQALPHRGNLERELAFPWAELLESEWGHPLQPVTLGQSVLQVAMHSTHHRAQVAARLRELGNEPPALDYIRWLWRGRPSPDWPSEVTES